MDPSRRARQRLQRLKAAGLLRRVPRVDNRTGVRYELNGRPVVGFCSNDYLGLADDPRLDQIDHVPSGASASRLICGDLPHHRSLETRLAAMVGADDAIVFPSGFQLNVGVLPTLLELNDRVDSDALNHASLIDGMRLAAAHPSILGHGKAPTPRAMGHRSVHWWVTESIFSMDGDCLDAQAAAHALEHGIAMYVDEAHAIGLFAGGQGLLGHHGVRPTVLVGTLSKAFGCAGAFIASSRPICTLLRNRARSFVFSTALSPALALRIARAVTIVSGPLGDGLRTRLWNNARHLGAALGLPSSATPSPILPIVIGDNRQALSIAARLYERGWHVQAIRPPTVPVGTARLRITVSAAHEPDQIDALAADVHSIFRAEDLPLRIERGLLPAAPPPAASSSTRLKRTIPLEQ